MAFKISGKQDWEFPKPLPAAASLFGRGAEAGEASPSVLGEFWNGMRDGSFLSALWASLMRGAKGFSLALLIGVALGLLLSASRFFQWLIGPLVLGVQSLPSICWLPVAIFIFGLNETAILFVVLMGSVGSITLATRDGLSQVPQTLHRVGQTFGANYWQRLFWVNIPAALPVFISGLKQGWSFAWRSLLAAELIQHVIGVGALLDQTRNLTEYPRMFACMILILLVSVFVDKIFFTNLEKRIRSRWGMAG